MNRILFAAALAGAGFATTAIAQTMPTPAPMPPADDGAAQTRDQAMARADARFDRMDTNRDGKLTPDEMRPARPMAPASADASMPPPPADSAAGAPGSRMFARLDTNADGAVDRSEWRALAARRFDRVDANHDGVIDAAEREAARDAMGAMGRRGAAARPAQGAPMPPPAGAQDPNAGQ